MGNLASTPILETVCLAEKQELDVSFSDLRRLFQVDPTVTTQSDI